MKKICPVLSNGSSTIVYLSEYRRLLKVTGQDERTMPGKVAGGSRKGTETGLLSIAWRKLQESALRENVRMCQ